MSIKAIIFDLGGVMNEGYTNFITPFGLHGIQLKQDLWEHAHCHALIRDFCTGQYGNDEAAAKQFAKAICKEDPIGQEIPFEQFKRAWNAGITVINDELIDSLDVFKKAGYQLFVLSDSNVLHRAYFEKLYQQHYPEQFFNDYFVKCYFSDETGESKSFSSVSNNKAWLQILNENHLEPEMCLFIDDKAELIHRAKKLGFHALHYVKGATSQSIFNRLSD